MSSLNEIRKRISAVNNTSKITQAMKLVATAKIQRQKADFIQISSYINELYEMLLQLTKSTSYDSVFVKKNKEANKNLHILVSSSLGLCGPYNINVAKHLINQISSDDDIIVIGSKGYSYLKSRGYKHQIVDYYEFTNSRPSHISLLPLSQYVINNFALGNYKNVYLTYTKYQNSINFFPTTSLILPLSRELFASNQEELKSLATYELNDENKIIDFIPNRHRIVNKLIPFLTSSMIIAAMIESQLCEYSSRRNAMESATDNAKGLIDNLKLEYNQARQEKITQEINEIVAGS
ncbi:MAG: ATP synthase F1 subunit gamma [Mycoplasma sp.]